MLLAEDWKTVVVTGGTGFLGRRLRARLSPASRVVDVVSPERAVDCGDGRAISSDSSPAAFSRRFGDTSSILIFHLATRYVPSGAPYDLEQLVESNVAFPSRLIEGAVATGARVRIVNPSTLFQYYGESRDLPISLYAATKEALRAVLRGYAVTRGVCTADLVIGDTYASDDHRPKLIPHLLRCARTGERVDLGSGRQVMSLMHADDVVDALVAVGSLPAEAFSRNRFRTWVPAGSVTVTVAELVSLVQATLDGRPKCSFDASRDRPHEMMHGLDSLDLETIPGFVPRRSLRSLLEDAAAAG